MEFAIHNNLDIKIQSLIVNENEVDLQIAKNNFLPGVYFSANSRNNNGRSIDPFTNVYTNNHVYSNSGSLNFNQIIFKGGQFQNQLRLEKNDLELAKLTFVEKQMIIKELVLINYISLFEMRDFEKLVLHKIEINEGEIARNKVLLEEGIVTRSTISELEAEFIEHKTQLIDIRHRLDVILAKMSTLLSEDSLTIDQFTEFKNDDILKITTLEDLSIDNTIRYKIALMNEKKSTTLIKLSKANYYPIVSFNAGVFTGYSSERIRRNPVTGIQEKYPLRFQYSDNFLQYISLNLDFPLFNKFQNKLSIEKARINLKVSQLAKERVRNEQEEQKKIYQSKILNEHEKYILNDKKLNHLAISYQDAKQKFDRGRITMVEYLIKKNLLFDAEVDLQTSKYNYLLYKELYELWFNIK